MNNGNFDTPNDRIGAGMPTPPPIIRMFKVKEVKPVNPAVPGAQAQTPTHDYTAYTLAPLKCVLYDANVGLNGGQGKSFFWVAGSSTLQVGAVLLAVEAPGGVNVTIPDTSPPARITWLQLPSILPPAKRRYTVLQPIDDNGTLAFDRVRFSE